MQLLIIADLDFFIPVDRFNYEVLYYYLEDSKKILTSLFLLLFKNSIFQYLIVLPIKFPIPYSLLLEFQILSVDLRVVF